jgi:hypothetical protein
MWQKSNTVKTRTLAIGIALPLRLVFCTPAVRTSTNTAYSYFGQDNAHAFSSLSILMVMLVAHGHLRHEPSPPSTPLGV